jgi:hypothetical protein
MNITINRYVNDDASMLIYLRSMHTLIILTNQLRAHLKAVFLIPMLLVVVILIAGTAYPIDISSVCFSFDSWY